MNELKWIVTTKLHYSPSSAYLNKISKLPLTFLSALLTILIFLTTLELFQNPSYLLKLIYLGSLLILITQSL